MMESPIGSGMGPDTNHIRESLQQLRPAGAVLLTGICPSGKRPLTGRQFLMPDELDEAVDWAVSENQDGRGVYWTPNAVEPGVAPKAEKGHMIAALFCWVDADPNIFKHKSYEKARQEMAELASGMGRLCSFVIDSGHGTQLFWRLEKPISLDGPQRAAYEAMNVQLAQWVEAPPGCHNADRIMRLPGTINYPTGAKVSKGYPQEPSISRLLSVSDRRYSLAGLDTLSRPRSAAQVKLEQFISESPAAAARWSGDASGLNDPSGSAMDMSMATMLRLAHFSFEEAVSVLRDWPHGSVNGRMQGERYWRRLWERNYAAEQQNVDVHINLDQPGLPHPLLRFTDYATPQIEAPEFVIDGLIQAGIVMIAGASGVGKTTCLVPLFAAAAHLCPPDFAFKPKVRRRVIYIAEDTGQAKRVIHSLRTFGGAEGTDADWQDRFRLVQAQRMNAARIAEIAEEVRALAYENVSSVSGVVYSAAPVIVLDTANATINLDNENDNAEVGKAIAILKQRLAGIPLVIVAHTTKANKRADATELSARGAGAWEADAQQTLVLFMDEADPSHRYMMLGKRRFETSTKEVRFVSSVHQVTAIDVLGEPTEITVRHATAVPCHDGEREQARAEAKERTKSVERYGRLQKAISLVRQANQKGEIITRSALAKQLGVRKGEALEDIAELIDDGELVEVAVSVAVSGNNNIQLQLLTKDAHEARKYAEVRG